jgi:hypothetical protein
METAAEMDRRYRANPSGVGALHCIPLVLKDNFNTADMPTSGGNVSMKNSRPSADAFTVAKLRKAGALILGKANLQEFARGGMSKSSLGGQVLNPYDLTRTPGGSSGGTGASVAANLALAGTGSDTGQSIRSHRPRTISSECDRRAASSAATVSSRTARRRTSRPHRAHRHRCALILDVMADTTPPIRSRHSGAVVSPQPSRICCRRTHSRVRASAR